MPPAERLPRHVAIIMDGNGRWARQRGFPRFAGHRAGAKTVRLIVEECARLGLRQLTLYSFSTENWNRPQEEVGMLMDLYVEYMRSQRQLLIDNNIQFVQIGRREGLPAMVLARAGKHAGRDAEKHRHDAVPGDQLWLAHGDHRRGEADRPGGAIRGSSIRRQSPNRRSADRLYTAGMPDPDLLIRTAGEMRISNYLLWQISYAELYVTDVFWPEFSIEELHKAFRNFAARNRRFGGVDHTNT